MQLKNIMVMAGLMWKMKHEPNLEKNQGIGLRLFGGRATHVVPWSSGRSIHDVLDDQQGG